ncbi:hypothetical protein FOA52_008231 [Chlamydomonas sp. UWO 241]|nr:hypothetical protein FOA52_008231 [Chlamydomonas sp. UWO 241]
MDGRPGRQRGAPVVGCLLFFGFTLLPCGALTFSPQPSRPYYGDSTFPHRHCYDNVTDGSIVVDRLTVAGQQLSFTIRGTGAAPLHAACTQDLFRISINTFPSCSASKLKGYMNGARIRNPFIMEPGMAPGSTVIKVYMPTNITWASITATPITITLLLNDKPRLNACNVFNDSFSYKSWSRWRWHGEWLPPWRPAPWWLLNTLAATPIDLALFSSDESCCPTPVPLIVPTPPSPPPVAACKACSAVILPVSANTPPPSVYAACNNLATLMIQSPVLIGIAAPGGLQFVCSDPNVTDGSGTAAMLVCAPGTSTNVNTFVDSVIANFNLYMSLAIESLGLRLLLPPSSSCSAGFNISSSCGNSESGSGVCPQLAFSKVRSPLLGDSSWDFSGASSKGTAVEQAQNLVVQMQTDPSDPNSVSTEINDAKMQLMWRDWVRATGLADEDDLVAHAHFRANMEQVISINLDPNVTSWWASGNQFSYLPFETFSSEYTGAISPDIGHDGRLASSGGPSSDTGNAAQFDSPAPAGINWVERGMVTPVRHQGGCAACCSFVAASLVESSYLISGHGNSNSLGLSEQQLVACTNPLNSPFNGYGCRGGWIDSALDYIAWASIDREFLWPYTASDQSCDTSRIASITSGDALKLRSGAITVTPANSEEALKKALLGAPVGIYYAVDSSFQNYGGGLFSANSCSNTINHASESAGSFFSSFYMYARGQPRGVS